MTTDTPAAPEAVPRRLAASGDIRLAILRWLLPALVLVALLLLWEWWVRSGLAPPIIVPAPSRIWQSFFQDWGTLGPAFLSTMATTAKGFALAVAGGTLLAILFAQSRLIEYALYPYAVILQVTPIVAIAPLIIILVKNTQVALTVCATVVAIFPIISNTTLGLRSVDPGLVNLFRMNRAGRLQTLWRLRIPSALPYFFGGLRISSGLALIGAVVAEFVAGTGGRSAGLAYEILQSGFQLDIPRMFAALFLITITGVLLFLVMVGLSKLALGRWHDSEARQDI